MEAVRGHETLRIVMLEETDTEQSLLQVGRHVASDSSRYNPPTQTKCGLRESDHRGRSMMAETDTDQLLANDEVQFNSPEASLRASTHMSYYAMHTMTLHHSV